MAKMTINLGNKNSNLEDSSYNFNFESKKTYTARNSNTSREPQSIKSSKILLKMAKSSKSPNRHLASLECSAEKVTDTHQRKVLKRNGCLELLNEPNASNLIKANIHSPINSNNYKQAKSNEFEFNTRRGQSLEYDCLQNQMSKKSNQQNINKFKDSNNEAMNSFELQPNKNFIVNKTNNA